MSFDAKYLRRIASRLNDPIDRSHLCQIAGEYDHMKHDLERYVEIAATIGDVEEEAYRQGWEDGTREALDIPSDMPVCSPKPAEINERLKERKIK